MFDDGICDGCGSDEDDYGCLICGECIFCDCTCEEDEPEIEDDEYEW